MTSLPKEPSAWGEPQDAETTVRLLREQLDAAKARMREHREVMQAAGLTHQAPETPSA